MSIFYCTAHGKREDSDDVGYNVDLKSGEEFCDETWELLDEETDEDEMSYIEMKTDNARQT